MSKLSTSSKVNFILDGIKKLYKINPKFSWLLIIISLIGSIQYLPDDNKAPLHEEIINTSSISDSTLFTISIISIVLLPLIVISIVTLVVIIEGMFAYTALQSSKGKKPTIKEAFRAAKGKFWTLLLVGIIVLFKVIGGLILFIIPGIRAICRYYPASMVVFDKNLSASDTVEYTKKISKNNLAVEFILILASSVIAPIGYFIQYGGLAGLYPWMKKNTKENAN